ncbi:hypothetical protein F2Q70_00009132 [Brassica cretica]|uniref:Uncharacterized protein n=1 Tax=Brassica cretica TaxID=69181 RepID=A0A8S9LY59_BRACR|nr:hypothetical protein F2Q70_00009132 [Brassica cretica]
MPTPMLALAVCLAAYKQVARRIQNACQETREHGGFLLAAKKEPLCPVPPSG